MAEITNEDDEGKKTSSADASASLGSGIAPVTDISVMSTEDMDSVFMRALEEEEARKRKILESEAAAEEAKQKKRQKRGIT